MAEKPYKIKVPDGLVEVSKEVYQTYYRMRRREMAQRERDAYNHSILYSALDQDEILGEDMLPDLFSPQVEEQVITGMLAEKLHGCIERLSSAEQKLIHFLYDRELSERQVALEMGIPYMTVHNRKVRILRKLRKMMDK